MSAFYVSSTFAKCIFFRLAYEVPVLFFVYILCTIDSGAFSCGYVVFDFCLQYYFELVSTVHDTYI